MKVITGIAAIAFVGAVGWRIGGTLSTDALGMAVGMLFGVMAGIPTALILLASERRTERHTEAQRPQIAQKPAAPQIVNHYHYHQAPTVLQDRNRRAEVERRHMLTGPSLDAPAPRQFRVVGSSDEAVDNW